MLSNQLISVAYWTPSDLGGGRWGGGVLIFQCHSFLPFHTVHGVLAARILEWVPSVLLQWATICQNFTTTRLSWVTLPSVVHSFFELCKFLCQDKAVTHERLVVREWISKNKLVNNGPSEDGSLGWDLLQQLEAQTTPTECQVHVWWGHPGTELGQRGGQRGARVGAPLRVVEIRSREN